MRVISRYVKYVLIDAFGDLVPFVQYKKREKHPWKSFILATSQANSLQRY